MSISFFDYITASGKYLEREKSTELTPEVVTNATKLLEKVNALLKDLGIAKVTVSSGFRPSAVNKAIPNAAKASLHQIGLAIDIADPDGKLDALIASKDELLKKYGLWQEDIAATPTWAHLDLKNRGKRAKNQFKP